MKLQSATRCIWLVASVTAVADASGPGGGTAGNPGGYYQQPQQQWYGDPRHQHQQPQHQWYGESQQQQEQQPQMRAQYRQAYDQDQVPAEEPKVEEDALPPGWSEYTDPSSGRPYYYNANDGTTTWDRPVSQPASVADVEPEQAQPEDERLQQDESASVVDVVDEPELTQEEPATEEAVEEHDFSDPKLQRLEAETAHDDKQPKELEEREHPSAWGVPSKEERTPYLSGVWGRPEPAKIAPWNVQSKPEETFPEQRDESRPQAHVQQPQASPENVQLQHETTRPEHPQISRQQQQQFPPARPYGQQQLSPPEQKQPQEQQRPLQDKQQPKPQPGAAEQRQAWQQPPQQQGPSGQYYPYGQSPYGQPQQGYGSQQAYRQPPPGYSPYGQYSGGPPGYGQNSPSQYQSQLIPQGRPASTAVKDAIGSAWQGILGWGNRTKEVVGQARDTVVSSATAAGQSVASTSAGIWGQAKNSLGAVFESSEDKTNVHPYSLSGQYGAPPPPGQQQQQQQGYPSQYVGYPPQYSAPRQREIPPYPHQQQVQQQRQPPPQTQWATPPQQGYPPRHGYTPQQGYPLQQEYSPQQGYPSQVSYGGPSGRGPYPYPQRQQQQTRGSPQQQQQQQQQRPPQQQEIPRGQQQLRRPDEDPSQHPGWQ